MPRQLLICLAVLMLLLQGVTQVSADALPSSQMQEHCEGHDTAPEDCPCCADELMLNGGCTNLCSMAAALLPASLRVPSGTNGETRWLVVAEFTGPSYLPLHPPPIP